MIWHRYLPIAAVLAQWIGPATAPAQSPWLAPRQDHPIALEVVKPIFDEDDFNTLTSAAFLSFTVWTGENASIVAELPFAYAGVDDGEFSDGESSTTLGNPYVGVEIRGKDSPSSFEIGVRAPLTSDEEVAALVGAFADIDRFEAFLPDVVSLSGFGTYRSRTRNGVEFVLHGGPIFAMQTDPDGGDQAELNLRYAAQIWYRPGAYALGLGATGRAFVTEDGNFGERTAHQVGIAANVDLGGVRPGIQVRIPLDEDLRDLMDFTVGLSLQVATR